MDLAREIGYSYTLLLSPPLDQCYSMELSTMTNMFSICTVQMSWPVATVAIECWKSSYCDWGTDFFFFILVHFNLNRYTWLIALLLERPTTLESALAALCPRDRGRKTGLWIHSWEVVLVLPITQGTLLLASQEQRSHEAISLLALYPWPAIYMVCLFTGFGILTNSCSLF